MYEYEETVQGLEQTAYLHTGHFIRNIWAPTHSCSCSISQLVWCSHHTSEWGNISAISVSLIMAWLVVWMFQNLLISCDFNSAVCRVYTVRCKEQKHPVVWVEILRRTTRADMKARLTQIILLYTHAEQKSLFLPILMIVVNINWRSWPATSAWFNALPEIHCHVG